MSYSPSRSKPGNWQSLRKHVLTRDANECQIQTPGICTFIAKEVDHIRPISQGGNDELTNLRAACPACHAQKSRTERIAGLRNHYAKRRRPKEPDPGYVIPHT